MPENHLLQQVGQALPDWTARELPPATAMQGRLCRVVPLQPGSHKDDLYAAFATDQDARNWTYMPYGPFADASEFAIWLQSNGNGKDPLFHTILDNNDKATGLASYLRIQPETGVIEVGHIHFSPLLQRTPLSTEAMYLMMSRVFDELGYRRYEWKCDALNEPSRAAAHRLGFRFEGIFRQATIYKQRNRDTAWFAITDTEWPALKSAFETWLSPANFDKNGQQRVSLATLR